MANDCLVTKLKGTVSNPNLTTLGKLRVNIVRSSQDSTIDIRYVYGIDSPVANYYDNSGNLLGTFTGVDRYLHITYLNLPAGTAYIEIPYKYEFESLNLINLAFGLDSFSDLIYSKKMIECKIGWTSVKSSSPVSDLAQLPALTSIEVQALPFIGNISELANIASTCIFININSCNNIIGTVEDCAVAFYNKYSNSEHRVSINMPGRTFNGIAVSSDNIGIIVGSGIVEVKQGGVTMGTYDGSTWTYNN